MAFIVPTLKNPNKNLRFDTRRVSYLKSVNSKLPLDSNVSEDKILL